MARERTIPSPSTFIQDFGLNVNPPPAVRNKRVVIIGTSEDGPMYEPILIDKPEDAEYVWGRLNIGDLVRGIYECWDVQTGYPTVVGVRIGNGIQAALELVESSGSDVHAAQATATTAMKLEAKYPGQIYNQVTIGNNDNKEVAISNPKTGLITTFSVDTEHPNNPNVDVHNVAELVDAINFDRNLSSVITASYTPLEADYEVAISGASDGVIKNDSTVVEVSLRDINPYITTNGFMISSPVGSSLTACNNIIELTTVESVSISEWELMECQSKSVNKFTLFPLDGKGTAEWDAIQALKDYDLDNKWMGDPLGTLVSEFVYSLSKELVNDLPTSSGGYWTGGSPTNTFRMDVPICPDDSEETNGNSYTSTYVQSKLDPSETYANYSGNWTNATCQGIDTKLIDDVATRPSGLIKVYVSDDADINGFWQELPYDYNSGVYLSSYTARSGDTAGYATFSIGASASNNSTMRSLVDVDGVITASKFIRVTMNTVKGFLGEVESLPQLEDVDSRVLSTYFVRGQEVVFNKSPEFNITLNYGTRITYEPGSNVSLSDQSKGYVKFTNPDLLPGPSGGALSQTKTSYLRFKYTYMPNWPAITSSAKNLNGGTNGIDLSNKLRYDEYTKAYEKLRNYSADLWVPMGAFIDATSEQYNAVTGLKETINVGFHIQLEDFLEDLSINSIQPHAILGVTPMTDTKQTSKDEWVKKLTVTNNTDPTRAANVMALIQNKFMSVTAFEPIFLNIGRGKPYSASGQAVYAGFLASIPYAMSPTNKEIPGLQVLRYDLAVRQFEALNSMRYVTMKERSSRTPVIVEDVTAAPYGSDFVNWSTFSITAEASNRVRAVAETFIGKPNSVEVRNAMDQLIANALLSMSGLQASTHTITSTPNQQVLGIIEVDLILVPVFTIKKIRTTVKLRKSLPTAT